MLAAMDSHCLGVLVLISITKSRFKRRISHASNVILKLSAWELNATFESIKFGRAELSATCVVDLIALVESAAKVWQLIQTSKVSYAECNG